MTTEEASKLLGVVLPTTLNALKTAYKRASMKYHPDHNKTENAAQQFHSVKAAYELLQKNAAELEVETDLAEDGKPLSEFGKGLGPTTNGISCPECDGRGFRSFMSDIGACPDCREAGRTLLDLLSYRNLCWEYRCIKCGGSGAHPRPKHAGQDCDMCDGLGWNRLSILEHRRTGGVNVCHSCRGTHLKYRSQKKTHVRCGKCKGCGEIAMWNPVLPKGLLGL